MHTSMDLALEQKPKMDRPSEFVGLPSRFKMDVIPFTSGDGMTCNLVRIQDPEMAPYSRGPVLLVHGAGVRAQIFSAPTEMNFVRYLAERGYDVWLENWRASIDLPLNSWTLDDAAIHDHPAAVRAIVDITGVDQISAVIHCQGSTSFTMSLMAGLLPQVKTVVSNAVSVHPVVPDLSKVKLNIAIPLASIFVDHLNPQWGLERSGFFPTLLTAFVNLTHHECQNSVCKQVSFTYGSGFPALWRHENLNAETHEWLKYEFARVPVSFFKQMAKCVNVGILPSKFTSGKPKTKARIAFFSGCENLCFLPLSQRLSYEFFQQTRQDHAHYEIAGYGHLDIFMGQNAGRDIFPLMAAELEKPS